MALDITQLYSGPVTTVKIGGTDMGAVFDGVEIVREDEFFECLCDQVLGPVTKILTSRKWVVSLKGAELSLTNLETLLAQGSSNLTSSSLHLDDTEQGLTTLEVAHPAPSGVGTMTWKFDTVYNVSGGAMAFKKDGTQTVVPTTFDCLPNVSGDHGFVKLA